MVNYQFSVVVFGFGLSFFFVLFLALFLRTLIVLILVLPRGHPYVTTVIIIIIPMIAQSYISRGIFSTLPRQFVSFLSLPNNKRSAQ